MFHGGVDQLELRDHPTPEPGANEIQVRVAGASINPVDWKLRSGALKALMPLSLPAILGRDASGVVTKVGAGVTTFAPGDRVMGLVNGAYAELVVASRDAWAKLPGGLDLVDAGADVRHRGAVGAGGGRVHVGAHSRSAVAVHIDASAGLG